MSSPSVKVVVVSGGLFYPSKTHVLLEAMAAGLQQGQQKDRPVVNVQFVTLSELAPRLVNLVSRTALPLEVFHAIEAIETADFLVVGAPVYRASYPGLFKHLFDLVDYNALIDVPVLLAATGGSERHALVLEHQLRPLFSFFQSHTLPIGVYGTDGDFSDYRIVNAALQDRIDLAVERARPWLSARKQRVTEAVVRAVQG